MLLQLQGKQKQEMTLVIEGREIVRNGGRLLRTMDTCADAFYCEIPWIPGQDEKLDEITAPYSYSKCAVYIGDELQMSGLLYNVAQRQNADGISKELEIYTQTADLIDSTMWPPYEANNISLRDRCRQLCQPFGIQVVLGDGINLTTKRRIKTDIKRVFTGTLKPRYLFSDLSDLAQYYALPKETDTYKYKTITEEIKFPRVAAESTETIFNHLRKLAAQKGLLISCTKFGDLLITKANLAGKPVCTLADEGLADTYEAKFSGRNRFAVYRALGSSGKHGSPNVAAVVKDASIPAARILSFKAPDNLPGGAKEAAITRRNKAAAESMTFQLPVNSWYDPNGKLWENNTQITIRSRVIEAPEGFTFLIRATEFIDASEGQTCTLSLIPPFAYSLEE